MVLCVSFTTQRTVPNVFASLYHSGAQHLVILCIPDCKLAGCNAALRLVKKDVKGLRALDEPRILQRLTVTYTHAVTTHLALLHLNVRTYPMYIVTSDAETAA